ncbi:hypothetical protein QFC24_006373 [Naganishia onofrii]|uniref:Uncharacterized protein n=1 Tax=Naganishia onofrii TaxID=1851511 RepID=A0ACC2X2W3_9TREE|nr:hypothetical protein QFC24_006373 [Naganishia onofrii]
MAHYEPKGKRSMHAWGKLIPTVIERKIPTNPKPNRAPATVDPIQCAEGVAVKAKIISAKNESRFGRKLSTKRTGLGDVRFV